MLPHHINCASLQFIRKRVAGEGHNFVCRRIYSDGAVRRKYQNYLKFVASFRGISLICSGRLVGKNEAAGAAVAAVVAIMQFGGWYKD